MARRLVAATAGGAAVRRGVTEAWRTVEAAGPAPAFIFIPTIAEVGRLATVVVFGAAIFSKHPHVEGGVSIELEVKGAPPIQAARAGKRLPAAG